MTDLLETHHAPFRGTSILCGMQQAVSEAPNPGSWLDIRSVKTGSIEFFVDSTTGAVSAFDAEVMISNALLKPVDSADGAVALTVSALGVIELPSAGRWMKVKVTSVTVTGGGTLGAYFHGQTY
jgi:hypothetical protein